MYFKLVRCYPRKEQYGDTLQLCRHCHILSWKVCISRGCHRTPHPPTPPAQPLGASNTACAFFVPFLLFTSAALSWRFRETESVPGEKNFQRPSFPLPPYIYILFLHMYIYIFFSVHPTYLQILLSFCAQACMRTHTHTQLFSFCMTYSILDRGMLLWGLARTHGAKKPARCFGELKPNLDVPFQGTDHPCTANNPESCSVSLSPQDFINLFKF